MNYNTILKIIQNFYDLAKRDVMIGYHFRFIEDFEAHIPRIADFWNLQLTGNIEDKTHLPFNLLQTHDSLGIKRAEMGRWITIFQKNLNQFYESNEISKEDKEHFEMKVKLFQSKIEERIFT